MICNRGVMFRAFRSAVRSLTPILLDAISLYLAEGFQWNVAQMVITRAEIAERFPKLEVKGQRSRSRPDGGMHFDGVEL